MRKSRTSRPKSTRPKSVAPKRKSNVSIQKCYTCMAARSQWFK